MSQHKTPAPECLLILPRGFYAFASVIEKALARRGYAVRTANDEYPENFFGKVISKLGLPLSHWLTARRIQRCHLVGRRYRLILVIKGRGLNAALAKLLGEHADKVVGYHFDSFRYDRGPSRWISKVERVCTFDYRDAAEAGLDLVELFTSLPEAPPGQRPYRVSVIMRNHSQRLSYMDRVLTALGSGPAFIYIFESNWLGLVANFVRHPRLYLKYRKHISRKSLPYAEYVQALAGSEITVDYAHPKQTGITIRCFEALSAGTRIVTNNDHVLHSRYFGPENAIVFAADGAPSKLQADVSRWSPQQPPLRRRTVDDFLAELLDDGQAASMPDATLALSAAGQAPTP